MRRVFELNIDTNNLEELKKFFDDHYDYKPYEIALKYHKPVSTIRYWKSKIYKNKNRTSHFKNYKNIIEIETINDPKIWDNKEWFYEQYIKNKLGADTIARIICRSKPIVYRRLLKYEIKTRPHKYSKKPKNRYYNKKWLMYKYYYENRSLSYIAKIAKVNPYTISNWLVGFVLPPRTNSQSNSKLQTIKRIKRIRKNKYLKENGASIQKINRKTIQT